MHWLRGDLAKPDDRQRLVRKLQAILDRKGEGAAIAADLRQGLPTLPAWMQELVRELLADEARQPQAPRRRIAAPAVRQRVNITATKADIGVRLAAVSPNSKPL
jgi:hypothetical protein